MLHASSRQCPFGFRGHLDQLFLLAQFSTRDSQFRLLTALVDTQTKTMEVEYCNYYSHLKQIIFYTSVSIYYYKLELGVERECR